MADKNSKKFEPEQMIELSGGVKALVNNLEAKMDEIDVTFKALEGEEIIAESAQKTPIVDAIKNIRETYSKIAEKMTRQVAIIDNIASELGVAINTNIRTNEEAVAAISSVSKKAQEANGSGAR